jgi:hypothetical protein
MLATFRQPDARHASWREFSANTYRGCRIHLMERLLSLPSLLILFALSFLLTAEEAAHLLRSRPNSMGYVKVSFDDHPGCIPRSSGNTDYMVLECPIPGYGSMIFICSHIGCGEKEPSTGLVVTPDEAKRVEGKS